MNLTEMLGSMGLVGMLVMACLLALSVYSLGVILDTLRRYRAASRESSDFLPAFARSLREGKIQDAASAAKRHGRSHVARVVSAGVSELLEGQSTAIDGPARVQHVSRVLERSTETTLADLKKGLGGLATIGSTAPFIGLFGTVVGIIHSFKGIASTGSGGLAAVSGGIAEALIATALGILVALPAVMAFNHFTGSLERFRVEMSTTSAELVDWVDKRMRMAHADR